MTNSLMPVFGPKNADDFNYIGLGIDFPADVVPLLHNCPTTGLAIPWCYGHKQTRPADATYAFVAFEKQLCWLTGQPLAGKDLAVVARLDQFIGNAITTPPCLASAVASLGEGKLAANYFAIHPGTPLSGVPEKVAVFRVGLRDYAVTCRPGYPYMVLKRTPAFFVYGRYKNPPRGSSSEVIRRLHADEFYEELLEHGVNVGPIDVDRHSDLVKAFVSP